MVYSRRQQTTYMSTEWMRGSKMRLKGYAGVNSPTEKPLKSFQPGRAQPEIVLEDHVGCLMEMDWRKP